MSELHARPITVLIVDDHGLVREGMKRLVENANIVVAGEAACASEALSLLAAHAFDVAVLDINLPDTTGIELLQVIKRQWPHIQVLILSAAPEEHYAVRAIRAGASGYLTKEGDLEALVRAIREISAGKKYITPQVGALLAQHFSVNTSAPLTFTERELEVLKLIAKGKSTSQIAQLLRLSDKTVGTYRTRIQDKTGLKSNAELTRYALEQRLLS